MELSSYSGEIRPAGAVGSEQEQTGLCGGDLAPNSTLPIGLTADDLQCPICVDTIHDAFVTTCGHTFCYQCITTHLKHRRNCPSCGNYLTTDHIYPNFLLSKVLVRAAATHAAETSSSLADLVQQALVGTDKKLHIADLDEVIGLLKGKRDQLARHEATSSLQLLLLFLKEAKKHKEKELAVLGGQLQVLERDLQSVARKTRQGGMQPLQPLLLPPLQLSLQQPELQQQQEQQKQKHPHQHPHHSGALLPNVQQHQHSLQQQQQQQQQHPHHHSTPLARPVGGGTNSRAATCASGLVTVKRERADTRDEVDGDGGCGGGGAQGCAAGVLPAARVKQEEGDNQGLPTASTSAQHQEQQQQQQRQMAPATHQLAGSSPQPACTLPMATTPGTAPPDPTAVAAAAAGAVSVAGSAQVPELPSCPAAHLAHSLPLPSSALDLAALAQEMHSSQHQGMGRGGGAPGGLPGAAPITATPAEELGALRAAKKRRILHQFEQLQSCYLQLRAPPAHKQQEQEQQQQQHPPHPNPPPEHMARHQQGGLQPGPGSSAACCPASPPLPSSSPPVPEQQAWAPAAAAAAANYTAIQPLLHPRLRALGSTAGGPGAPTGSKGTKDGRPDAGLAPHQRTDSSTNLQQFSQVLSTVTQHSRMACQAEVPFAACGGWLRSGHMSSAGAAAYPQPSTAILDLEFDADEELLATCAGQRVFLWDYDDVLSTTPDSLEPVRELCCRSKLASISFSKHERALLAAGDAEGRVYLWDVSTRQVLGCHAAHERRVWALDFTPSGAACAGPGSGGALGHLLASGSDDHLLKVWSPKEQRPVAVVDAGANVCSVRFNPWQEHLVAVGSAAHSALVYDLRMLRGSAGSCVGPAAVAQPLASFGGHKKAVAYVRWAGEQELLSASTDSTLRLWSLHGVEAEGAAADLGLAAHMSRSGSKGMGGGSAGGQGEEAVRTYSGHTNERNFVGLSHSGNYIATGSETGEVIIYFKHINTPSICHRLTSNYQPRSQAHHPHVQQPPPFISAVAWRQRSQTLMAANSQGHLWVLALQQ